MKKTLTPSMIAFRIRKARTDRHLSQGALAKRAGLSLNTIVKIELRVNENPTIGTLRSIAAACNVKVHEFIP